MVGDHIIDAFRCSLEDDGYSRPELDLEEVVCPCEDGSDGVVIKELWRLFKERGEETKLVISPKMMGVVFGGDDKLDGEGEGEKSVGTTTYVWPPGAVHYPNASGLDWKYSRFEAKYKI